MLIHWFTENYPPNTGGMARSCDRIVFNLRKHHTVHIYHFTNKLAPFETTAQVNGSYTAIPVYEDAPHTLNNLWAFIKNKPEIKTCDALVSYGSHLCLKGLPLMAKWLEKPLLTCFRGNDFDTAIFSQKKQDVLYAIAHASAIACVSKEKAARIKALQLNDHICYTPNAISAEQWDVLDADTALSKQKKAQLNISKGTTVVGLVGFLKQKKGIDFFIKGLRKSVLYKKCHLHIVGDIDLYLVELLTHLDIPYSIVKPESHTDLMANYLLCDVVAIPSIYDGMPNVIFEAGILEVPIIASDAGGNVDILNTDNAFVFNTLSELSLLKALNTFNAASTATISDKITNLKTLILQEYTPEKEIERYLTIFETITP